MESLELRRSRAGKKAGKQAGHLAGMGRRAGRLSRPGIHTNSEKVSQPQQPRDSSGQLLARGLESDHSQIPTAALS